MRSRLAGRMRRTGCFARRSAADEALADDIEMWLLVLLCGDDADLCGGTGGGVRRVAVGLCFI